MKLFGITIQDFIKMMAPLKTFALLFVFCVVVTPFSLVNPVGPERYKLIIQIPGRKYAQIPRYELRVDFADESFSSKHQKYKSPMDACRILPKCFMNGTIFGTTEQCTHNLDSIISNHDVGYWVEVGSNQDDRLVGFLTIKHEMSVGNSIDVQYHALFIDNVCVGKEHRSKGIAKQMIPKFIDEVVKHYRLEKFAYSTGKEIDISTGYRIPPLLIGLDVDLESETMPDAFALYSKLCFLRWWTPCISVTAHNWIALIEMQMSSNNPNHDESTGFIPKEDGAEFPLAQLFWNPSSYIEKVHKFGSGRKQSLFCMYKFYSDSFKGMARSLMNYPQNSSDR